MLLCSFINSPRPWPLDLGVVGACNGAPLNAGDSSVTRAQKAGGATYSLMSSQAHRLAELHDYLLSACRVWVPRVSLQWSLWIEIDRLGSQSGWLFCTRAGADQVGSVIDFVAIRHDRHRLVLDTLYRAFLFRYSFSLLFSPNVDAQSEFWSV
jgi:hypothetical protein